MPQNLDPSHYWSTVGHGMELSDKEYVARCLGGNPEAFRPLVERYQRLVFSHLAGRMRDPWHAEEATQEAFVRAFQNLKRLKKPESFYAWLLGIAGRVALEQLREQQRTTQNDKVLDLLADQDAEPPPSLEAALAALPEVGRRLIQLRYYEGLSCQEVALRLDMPLGTVTKTLSRAFGLLRQELSKQHFTKPEVHLSTLRSGHELR